MSLEAIKAVENAEAEAARVLAEAATEAKRIVAAAEAAGREAMETARQKAVEELRSIKTEAAEKTATEISALQSTMDAGKAVLRASAESRLELAADKILERIVNAE